METHVNPPDLRRDLARWVVKNLFYLALTAACLFVSAGRTEWVQGWIYLGLIGLIQILNAVVLLPSSPELLVERSQMQAGTKAWDKWLAISVALLGPLTICIVGGLDRRYGWSPSVPVALVALGFVIALLGGLLGLWAMASNHFFSGTVRIQAERGHTVATGGPYRYVRHPGYLGALLFDLASPLVLGSWWTFIPALLTVGALVIRTSLEDRTLIDELDGYRDFSRSVPYRLIPGLW